MGCGREPVPFWEWRGYTPGVFVRVANTGVRRGEVAEEGMEPGRRRAKIGEGCRGSGMEARFMGDCGT